MERRMFVEVRGRQHEWSFEFIGDPKYLEEWRSDGLRVFEIAHTIPAWVVDIGLSRVWCAAQSICKAIYSAVSGEQNTKE